MNFPKTPLSLSYFSSSVPEKEKEKSVIVHQGLLPEILSLNARGVHSYKRKEGEKKNVENNQRKTKSFGFPCVTNGYHHYTTSRSTDETFWVSIVLCLCVCVPATTCSSWIMHYRVDCCMLDILKLEWKNLPLGFFSLKREGGRASRYISSSVVHLFPFICQTKAS